MIHPQPHSSSPSAVTTTGFTAVGTFNAYGRAVNQTQYISDRYVITEIATGIFVFLASHRERFVFEAATGSLRRLEPNPHRIQTDKLRVVIGEIEVWKDESQVEVEGFSCERYHFRSAESRVLIEGETLAARVPGLESTALRLERDHDATIQPFSLPLAPDQVVVRSLLRTSASGFDQVQSYRLVSVRASIDDPDRFARLVELPILV